MSSFTWQIQDLAQFDIAFWLSPGGQDNGVWADTWAMIADLESGDVAEVLDLLAEADVGGYVAIPGGQKARAKGPVCHRLWVDSTQYHRAEDVLIRFLRDRERKAERR
jgi:hypothetical protein